MKKTANIAKTAKKVKIKSMDMISVAKIFGIMYLLIGLIIGFFMAVFVMLGAILSGSLMGLLGGIATIILLPIFYGAGGFVMGLISAALYNLIAKWVGGIEVEVE